MTLKVAYVFPGQGSQSLGMLADLSEQYPTIIQSFSEASERLSYDLWQLVQHGPEEKLHQTQYTQAAMLTADVAVYRLLQLQGAPKPQLLAGHSLGEYAALVASGVLSLADAAWLVGERGRIMQAYVPEGVGAMAAIVGLTDEHVIQLCDDASDSKWQVSPANFNAIGQVVVAGHAEAVQRAIDLATEQEARLAKIIPVSVPCHCALLKEAAEEFATYLDKTHFNLPECAVISNVDLSIYDAVTSMKALLTAQLYSPVRWVETILLMKKKSIDVIVETGPGKVLSGLSKRIDKTIPAISVYDNSSLQDALTSTLRG